MSRAYRALALFAFNAALVLLAANLVLAPFFRSERTLALGLTPKDRDPRGFAKAYPGRTEEEIASILDETWSRPLVYAPFVEFREAPFKGRWVNVDEAGFRASQEQGPWPPAKESVFVFGGSTTFGYGVPDGETIASFLQEELRASAPTVSVYNFGCGYYFSTQERLLFERLLSEGRAPTLAIFIDGLNEFYFGEDPMFADRLRRAAEPSRPAWVEGIRSLPVSRALIALGRKVAPPPKAPPVPGRQQQTLAFGGRNKTAASRMPAPGGCADPGRIDLAIGRYLGNKQLIEAAAASAKVRVLFDWQPIPVYRYDRSHHATATSFGKHECAGAGYPVMEERSKLGELGDDFLWSADIQEGLAEPLYVDTVHYGKGLAEPLARHIAAAVRDRDLLR